MKQLIMRWVNDGTPATLTLPKDVKAVRFTEYEGAMEAWLDIMRYMTTPEEPILMEGYYHMTMTAKEHFRADQCWLLLVDGIPAASITVICNYEKQQGYIHMVCAKPQFRGKGLGKALNDVALNVLKTEGMKTAYLHTDDFRLPAIKTYLNAGFTPDLDKEPDYKERWDNIYAQLAL